MSLFSYLFHVSLFFVCLGLLDTRASWRQEFKAVGLPSMTRHQNTDFKVEATCQHVHHVKSKTFLAN